MTRKNILIVAIAAIAALVAVILAVYLVRHVATASGGGEEEVVYDRATNPEYQQLLEFEKAEQKKTMGKIAVARQNLAEARQAELEPEIIKELENEVASAESELERERERMRANLRYEIWKEQHPEQINVIEKHRAVRKQLMAEAKEAKKLLDEAVANGASDAEIEKLKKNVDDLAAKLVKSQEEAERELQKLNNR